MLHIWHPPKVTTGYSTTGHLLHRQQGVGGTSVFGGAVSSTSLRSRSNGTGAGATTFSESYFERELPELRSLVHEPRPNSEYRFKSTGAVYSGQWLGKERHGVGQMVWPDGTKYVGEWQHNQAHGKGPQKQKHFFRGEIVESMMFFVV